MNPVACMVPQYLRRHATALRDLANAMESHYDKMSLQKATAALRMTEKLLGMHHVSTVFSTCA